MSKVLLVYLLCVNCCYASNYYIFNDSMKDVKVLYKVCTIGNNQPVCDSGHTMIAHGGKTEKIELQGNYPLIFGISDDVSIHTLTQPFGINENYGADIWQNGNETYRINEVVPAFVQ